MKIKTPLKLPRQAQTKAKTEPKTKTKTKTKSPKYSRTQAPQGMDPAHWQRVLREQFGREQRFGLTQLGTEPFFSEFQVSNATSNSQYRVAVRGLQAGDNHCTCADFATNELGTCKHIEFTLAHLQAKRGGKTAFKRGWQPVFSELYLRHAGPRALYFRAGLDCPSVLKNAATQLFGPATVQDPQVHGPLRLLGPQTLDALQAFAAQFAAHAHTLHFYDDAKAFVARLRDSAHRHAVLAKHHPAGHQDPALSHLLKVALYPYQVEGALFAVQAGRALIADDMGLGKTPQAIAAAELLARHFGVSRVLVVCPTSLKYQWQSEMARFAGRQARVLTGGRKQRVQDFTQEDFCKITNYEKLQSDLDLVTQWAPDLIIVDEAQRIKNWNTIAARALKRIDSPYAIVLTGTPLENKLEELISIVQFVDQHRLGPTWRLLHEHQVKDESGRVTGYTGLEKIGQTLSPIMIRRHKKEVLQQLPMRTDQNLFVPITEAQAAVHQENATIVQRIVLRWRRSKYLSEADQRRLTCALQNMRMVCNSTYLLDQTTDHGVKADELMSLLDGLLSQPEAKVVVFSQWVRSHHILSTRLQARGWGHVSFHGGVASDRRPALVEQFRKDPSCRVFMSTDAGAAGLNLQHASTLVNMDLPWNPALLEQRNGRIDRMGQKQPVRIINLISKGTIEESMLSLLAFKRSLSAGILDGGETEIALGGSRLNRFMQEVDTVASQMDTHTPATEEGAVQDRGEASAASAQSSAIPAGKPSDTTPESAAPAPNEPLTDRPEVMTEQSAAPSAAYAPQSRPSATPTWMPMTDPWQALAALGQQLVQALHAAQSAPAPVPDGQAAGADPASSQHPWIERDPHSGQAHLKLPLPEPQVLSTLAQALATLAQGLGGR